MALDPQSIEHKRFTVARLKGGYDQAEVDDFLDHVQSAWSSDVEKLLKIADDRKRLERKIAEQEALIDRLRGPEAPTQVLPSASAERLLELAQKAHDEQIAAAGEEAVRITNEARAQAQAEADRIARDARSSAATERERIISDAREEREGFLAKIEKAREALS